VRLSPMAGDTDDRHLDNAPDRPWTIEADIIGTIREIDENEAADVVIVRYLKAGDTRALAWWLYEGHCPSPIVLKYIACMLQPGKADTNHIPFELISKSRTPRRGRPKKRPEQNLRDWLIYKEVSNLIHDMGRGSYDAAIAKVAELQGLNEYVVKRAYEQVKSLLPDKPKA